MIIHPHIPKRKPRKPNAKQRALRDSWNELLSKYEPKKSHRGKTTQAKALESPPPFRRDTGSYRSGEMVGGSCSKTESQQYTGTAMIGIATLHKSNAVPVFSTEDAVEISRMRRG